METSCTCLNEWKHVALFPEEKAFRQIRINRIALFVDLCHNCVFLVESVFKNTKVLLLFSQQYFSPIPAKFYQDNGSNGKNSFCVSTRRKAHFGSVVFFRRSS